MVRVTQAPRFEELVRQADPGRLPRILLAGIRPTVDGRYVHWDDIRFKEAPDELTVQEWWLGIKWARVPMLHALPLTTPSGEKFVFAMPDPVLDLLHRIDQQASGEIAISEEVVNPSTRDRYLVNSLIEEAIT